MKGPKPSKNSKRLVWQWCMNPKCERRFQRWACYPENIYCSRRCLGSVKATNMQVLKDRDQLVVLYVQRGMSALQISKLFGVHVTTAQRALKAFNIPARIGRPKSPLSCGCGKPTTTYRIFGETRRSSKCAWHLKVHRAEKSRLWMQAKRFKEAQR